MCHVYRFTSMIGRKKREIKKDNMNDLKFIRIFISMVDISSWCDF